jgi:[acyl-carrier-protein] S-malonyltransferase
MSESKISAVFPGQGSQSIGMGKELFDNFKVYQETLEEASDATGVDFKKLCFEGPSDELMLTENTQPAIVACSIGAFRVLKSEFNFNPSFTAGHSVGEYSALVASNVITFSDAITGVKLRGKSMQEAVPVGLGAMAALLGPSDEQVVDLCTWVENQNKEWTFEAANFNCPGQVVVSGSAEALDWLKENISNYEFNPAPKKLRLMPLKVSAPFHCKMMLPAENIMSEFLKGVEFSQPNYILIQNINAQEASEPEKIRENLIQQISGSVLWSKTISKMSDHGVKNYVEIGSGKTLLGMIKKIDSSDDLKLFNTTSLDDLRTFGDFLPN